MTSALANHLWQSTIFVLAAAMLTLALRENRAQLRFRIWFCASLKFLVPFAVLMSLGTRLQPPTVKQPEPAALSTLMVQASQPFQESGPLLVQSPTPAASNWIFRTIFIVWICGFAGIAVARWRQWRRIQVAVQASTPMTSRQGVEIRSAPGLLEPGVAGWRRPVLLLPASIESHLTAAQFETILAHELCHIRRRDNLTSAIHMLVESVFWFHPLVWWIGARLLEEREHACDEEVLQVTGDAKAYADAILEVCKRYVGSPLACVSGVSGSNLKKRLETIMTERIGLQLNTAKKIAIGAAGFAALAVPVLIGVMNTPVSAQDQRARFASATVRAANCDGSNASISTGGTAGTKRKGGDAAPGTLTVHCAALGGDAGLIRQAYIVFASGRVNVRIPSPALTGGPEWLDSAAFDIVAQADGTPKAEVMRGPMMQTLLEEKMKLKVHRESRDSDAYALVADGTQRLTPFVEGSCTPNDLSKEFGPDPERKRCSFFMGTDPAVGPYPTAAAKGATLADFGKLLSLAVDRPVIDATEIQGRYNFHLEFGIDESTPRMMELRKMIREMQGQAGTARPTILRAIQEQYGLKLVPTKAPREFLVIDHVERPSTN
jgi:bla regulator protein blaR1